LTDEVTKTDEDNIEDVVEADASTKEATTPEPKTEAQEKATTMPDNAELDAAKALAQKNHDKWQRALADFDNYKKRVERERVDTYDNAAMDVLKAILPIIDDFERAMENMPEEVKGSPWADGTSAIGRKLEKLLTTYEIDALDPVGKPFDPDRHQGLGIDENTDMESGHVTVTLQKGYMKGEKLLRPALVRVAG